MGSARKRGRRLLHLLLITPPYLYAVKRKGTTVAPPLGILYIAAYCLKRGFNVKFIDCEADGLGFDPRKPDKEKVHLLMRIISLLSPLVVGIGPCITDTIHSWVFLSRIVKKACQNSIVVVGGPHVSVPGMAELVLKMIPTIDVVVIGEGEETMESKRG